MPNETDAAEAFIARWSAAGGSERANYQLFIGELCALLGVEAPQPIRRMSSCFARRRPQRRGLSNDCPGIEYPNG